MLPQSDTRILLIGRGLRKIDKMIDTFNMVGAELLFADDPAAGLKMLAIEQPSLVVCHIDLPDVEAADLCRAIRSNNRLRKTPIVFAGDSSRGIDAVFSALNAGADDFFTEHFSSDHFLGKLVWMMEQKAGEISRRTHYESLKRRQMQTLDIVKETSELFRSIANDKVLEGGLSSPDERIEMGLGMISGLAGILEEQIKTVDKWFNDEEDRDPRTLFGTLKEPDVEECIELTHAM